VRIGAELLEHDDLDVDRGQLSGDERRVLERFGADAEDDRAGVAPLGSSRRVELDTKLSEDDVTVLVLEELGSDAHVFFRVEARPAGSGGIETADEDATLVVEEGALLTARVDPRTSARVGGELTVTVDPLRLHFFDPDTGASLLGPKAEQVSDPVPVAG